MCHEQGQPLGTFFAAERGMSGRTLAMTPRDVTLPIPAHLLVIIARIASIDVSESKIAAAAADNEFTHISP